MEIFVTYKKMKYLRMKVKNGDIYISSPFGVPSYKIKKFINDNMEFVNKEINRQNKIKESKLIEEFDSIKVFNKEYQVYTDKVNKVTENYIFVKEDLDKRKVIKYLFIDKQKDIFIKLTHHYYDLMNINKPFPNIIIKDVKSKWGQYNIKKNEITYASELIFKDEIVYDYIVVHELAHMIEFNHSSKFYDIVAKYLPNYKELRKKLKKE